MQITTENILKMIAKDTVQAQKLVTLFNSFDYDKKYIAEKKIWDLYDEYYEVILQSNVKKALAEARSGNRKLDADFYKQVKEQTDKEIEKEFYSDTQSADLAGVRDKISKIIGNSAS